MRVLQLLPYRFWGGPELQSFQLAAELHKAYNYTTDALFFYGKHSNTEDLAIAKDKAREFNIHLKLVPHPSYSEIFKARQELAQLLQKEKYDILVSSGYFCDILAVGQNVKKICLFHGWTAQNSKVKLFEKIDRFCLSKFDAVACVSKAQETDLARYNSHVKNISNCLDPQSLKPAFSRQLFMEKLGLKEPCQIILTVGRLSPEKGQNLALSALAKIPFHEKNIHWVFIGSGFSEKNLRLQSVQLGLQNNTHFLGLIPEAYRWMAAADLFVLPSLREGLPVALLEAFSQKVPVIATDVGGNSELVQDQRTGALVPSGQSDLLAQAVMDFFSHPQYKTEWPEKAYAHLQNNFTVKQQAERWHEVIQKVIS